MIEASATSRYEDAEANARAAHRAARTRRHEQAEANARGLLGAITFRAKLLGALFVASLLVNVIEFFWTTRQIALVQAAAAGGELRVLVLDDRGNSVNLPTVKAASWEGPNTGMIIDQLRQSVTCVRGLSTDARSVRACWEKELGHVGQSGKFVERAAAMLDDYANREYAPSADALSARIARESVQIQHLGVTHPDDDRWALTWRERVIDRAGHISAERVMTGTFTVRVVPLTTVDIERNSTGLQITYFDWAQDPSR